MKENHLRWSFCLLCVLLTGICLSVARAENKSGDYLKEGKLKERIEVQKLKGGVAGFTGTYFIIEPDGSWKVGRVGPGKKMSEPTAKGKLTAKQIAHLAKVLARYDLATLPDHGKPVVNPAVIKIRFGEKESVLLPKPEESSSEEDKAIQARYYGIVRAVEALCKRSKKQ